MLKFLNCLIQELVQVSRDYRYFQSSLSDWQTEKSLENFLELASSIASNLKQGNS